jgi:basic membrane protein A and related proteins
MPRIAAVVLAVALAVVAAGCGSKKSTSGSTATTTTTSATTTTGGGTFRVGLSTDTGGLNDRSFNHLAYVGLLRAEHELGVKGRVVLASSSSQYIPNLSSLARQGYNLVIGVGFTEIQAMEAVAKQFPKTHFAIVDVSNADEGHLPNVEGLLFKEQEAGYLAGYAAGLAAKRRGGKAVSTVGGQKQPPVDRYIAGFQAGAKAADPGIETPNGYSNDFSIPAKCKEVALNQIAAGSVVVFQVAGGCGLGALDAAKEKGVWGIGVDADQGYLGPYVLTSALKRVDTAVFNSIKDAKSGHFKGGRDAVYGIDVAGVGIGRFSPKTPAGIADAVAKLQVRMKAGEVKNIPTVVK